MILPTEINISLPRPPSSTPTPQHEDGKTQPEEYAPEDAGAFVEGGERAQVTQGRGEGEGDDGSSPKGIIIKQYFKL